MEVFWRLGVNTQEWFRLQVEATKSENGKEKAASETGFLR